MPQTRNFALAVLTVLLVPLAITVLALVRPLHQEVPLAKINGWFFLFVIGFPLSYSVLRVLGQLELVKTTKKGERLYTVIGLGLTIICATAIGQIFH